MVLEEQPAKIAEALRLFLQGNGYGMEFYVNFSRLRIVLKATLLLALNGY